MKFLQKFVVFLPCNRELALGFMRFLWLAAAELSVSTVTFVPVRLSVDLNLRIICGTLKRDSQEEKNITFCWLGPFPDGCAHRENDWKRGERGSAAPLGLCSFNQAVKCEQRKLIRPPFLMFLPSTIHLGSTYVSSVAATVSVVSWPIKFWCHITQQVSRV